MVWSVERWSGSVGGRWAPIGELVVRRRLPLIFDSRNSGYGGIDAHLARNICCLMKEGAD